MHRERLFWAGALFLNAAWGVLLPTAFGRAVGLAGALLALAILLTGFFAARRAGDPPSTRAPDAARRQLIALLPFLLAALSFVRTPTLVVWTLDGRAWLVLAWLAIAIRASLAPAADRESRAPWPVTLFVVWSAAFWLTVVWDVGVGAFVMNVERIVPKLCQSDPLSHIVGIWESYPVSRHLFLGWRPVDSIETGTVYVNHVHPYLLSMYGWMSAVRALTGRSIFVAANTTPFLYMAVWLGGIVMLLARLDLLRRNRDARGLLLLFCGVGFAATTWRFWNDLFRYNTDNPFPLIAGVLVFVYAALIPPVRPRLALISSVLFIALSPTHAPMLVLPLLVLFAQPASGVRDFVSRNRLVLSLCVAVMATGVVVAAAPRLLATWKGYSPVASTLIFRTGLDGDTTYFTNILQAVWAPTALGCYVRPPFDFFFPSWLPLLALAPLVWRTGEAAETRPGRLLLFLATPYLCSLVLFPQSLSVHPYLYDLFLLMPIIVAALVMTLMEPVRRRLSGTALLAFLLVAAGLIMSNLIGVAQMLAKMPK